MLWLLPAVILPLGALLVMQYEFLRTLEQKTASAQRNSLRGDLEQVTTELEEDFRRTSAAALNVSNWALSDVSRLGEHFKRYPVPGARTYFAQRFSGPMYESGYFDTNGVEKIATESEAEAVKMVTVSWHVAYKLNRVAQPLLYVDERDPKNRIILRPIVDPSWHVVGVAGVILDEQLAKAAMTAKASQRIRKRDRTGMIAIYLSERFPKNRGDGRDYITVPMGFVFTNWRAGIRDSCETPEEMAAVNFRSNMMWTGGSFVILVGAILLAVGAMARQMRLSQMKSDFVSNVSHELRTPLSSIRVFGEYMRLGRVTKEEKIREYGEYIEAESRRLTQLINNILDFSRIESAEKKYRFGATDIVDLVQHTVSGFEVPLRDQGVKIELRGSELRPMLSVDRDAIAQVLMNLLDNAVKYSNGDKRIEVTIETKNDEVRIGVRDHGIGIAPSEQKKIFEKFYRVGSGLVHDVKGSGLGLSIVQHVVEAHQGRVEIESATGRGSLFTIVLPLPKAPDNMTVRSTEFA
jgi:signal transduction histidine kinase